MKKSILISIFMFLFVICVFADEISYSNTAVVNGSSAFITPTIDLSSYSYVRVGFFSDRNIDTTKAVDFLPLSLVQEGDGIIGTGTLFVYYDIISNDALNVKLLANGPMMAGNNPLDWNIYNKEEALITGKNNNEYSAGVIGSKTSNTSHETDTVEMSIKTDPVTKADVYQSTLYVFIESVGANT